MEQFKYIIDKINDTSFCTHPFKYLYIEDLFSKEHFEIITQHSQINIPPVDNTEKLIDVIQQNKYSPVKFPGCTTSIKKYLQWYNSPKEKRYQDNLLEGFGISFRMHTYESKFIKELIAFLNGNLFQTTLKNKFELAGENTIETAIQKYMSGYEISPHPDIRKKCLTYMVNINTDNKADSMDLHTHFLEFKDDYKYIYDLWDKNPSMERCWVPWEWCETKILHTKNNSVVIFAPYNRSMHAVKLDYDHTKIQRTQIYGNLWYTKGRQSIKSSPNWMDLEKLKP